MVQSVHEIILKLKSQGMKETANQLSSAEKRINKLGAGASGTVNQMKILDKGSQRTSYTIKDLGVKVAGLRRNIFNLGDGIKTSADRMGTFRSSMQVVGKQFSKTTTNMKRFRMEWLSVMFFSMNVVRRLKGIMVSSVQTFTKIADKNNEAAQSVAALGAQFKFLQFTVGQAIGQTLEKHMPTIVNLVDAMADFVQQHPDEVVYGLVGALTALAGLNIAAQIALVSSGISQIAANASTATTKVGMLKGALGTLTGIVSLTLAFKGLNEDDVSDALINLGLSSAFAGATAALMFGASAATASLVGVLTFAILTQIKFNWLGKTREALDEFVEDAKYEIKERFRQLNREDFGFLDLFTGGPEGEPAYEFEVGGLENSKKELEKMNTSVNSTSEDVQKQNKKMFGKKKESYPLQFAIIQTLETYNGFRGDLIESYTILSNFLQIQNKKMFGKENERGLQFLLIQSQKEWITMREVAVKQIQTIISKLNDIPRNITTTHTIKKKTVGGGLLGSFQSGGVVPETGPYLLHKGETVVPNNNNVSNNVNVNVSGNQGSNPQAIARAVSNELNKQLRKYI